MSLVKIIKITPCFCLPLKGGTIFIAVIASVWSFVMWFASCITLIYSRVNPNFYVDQLYGYDSIKQFTNKMAQQEYQFWQFIRIVFFIFLLSAFIFSICLLHGVIKGKPKNMIPWLCIQFGGLFLFAGCNLAWLFTGHYFASRFEVMLGHVFGLFMLTMYIYIFMVLLSYYKLLTDKQVVTKKNSGRVYDASFVPNAPFESV